MNDTLLHKPSCRECRITGKKLYLKGAKCFGKSCTFEKRGPKMLRRGNTQSLYSQQNKEKRIVKAIYAITMETMKKYVSQIKKKNYHYDYLYTILDSRLDSIVYLSGAAVSRASARELILHGKILLNGEKHDKKGTLLQPGDTISVPSFVKPTEKDFLSVDKNNNSVTLITRPYENMKNNEMLFNARLIVEFVSKLI